MDQTRRLTLAVCQADAGRTGMEARFEWLSAQAAAARSEGAELVLFPELLSTGYNVGPDLHRHAEEVHGEFAKRVGTLAKELGIAIVYGYPEREGDAVYNAMIFVGADGRMLANHRKTVLPDGIEPDWFDVGNHLTMLRYADVRIALLICYEVEFPESVRCVTAAGAELVLVCTACAFEQVPRFVIPARAYENGVFVAYANYSGSDHGHEFPGLSCISDPFGIDLERAGATEQRLTTTLNLDLVDKARSRLPYLRDHRKVAIQTQLAGDNCP